MADRDDGAGWSRWSGGVTGADSGGELGQDRGLDVELVDEA